MKKVGLITTLDTNIGDDLIRLGVKKIINAAGRGASVAYVPINKHKPWTILRTSSSRSILKAACKAPLARYTIQSKISSRVALKAPSVFDDCDLIIQCGAPVYWNECYKAEWADALWAGTLERLAARVPILNLAAGSCYRWDERENITLSSNDRDFIRHISNICRATSVRDRLAQKVCASVGAVVTLIPCSAFLSAVENSYADSKLSNRPSLLISYMDGAGHYHWGQPIDRRRWEETVRTLVTRIHGCYEVSFLCHNLAEEHLVHRLWPEARTIRPASEDDYHQAIAGADLALCNRMHASVALASVGVPSIAVGTDTRLFMVAQLGLPVYFVNDATVDVLEDELEKMRASLEIERVRLLALREKTLQMYLNLLSETGIDLLAESA